MTYYTNEGKTYCVVGTAEGTVTSASGVVIASFSANEQSYFTAPAGGFVTISDETAIVTPVFKLAPSALVGESGGGDTPSGGKNTVTYTFAEDGTYGIEGDLSGLTDGERMFEGNKDITFWTVDLPNLTNGRQMFYQSALESFNGDLSNLTDGIGMFNYCQKLTEWNIPLPNLKSGPNMFYGAALESFNSDLSNLTDGDWMFYCCFSLTSFSGDLSSLIAGSNMFGSCKLNLVSVQNIANTINDLTGKTSDGSQYWGFIDIGISSSIRGNANLATALAAIRSKGWTVNDHYA